MTRVAFYVLGQSGEQARQVFACRLAEKAYKLEHTVHIHTGDRATAERIDDLLWTFRDGSFVPHQLTGQGAETDRSPVTVGSDASSIDARDLLINLSDDIPVCAGAFPRIAELVTSDEPSKQSSRRRFAAYRDQGYQIDTHKV
jgi:DNA polymerase-3 subunit chi